MNQSTCSFPSCTNPRHAKGLCSTHRAQQKKGQTLKPVGSAHHNKGETCHALDCDRPATRKRLCDAHYRQQLNGYDFTPIEPRRKSRPGNICTFEACGRPRSTWELCVGHYGQLMRKENLRPLIGSEGEDLKNFWSKVDKNGPDGCWVWKGKKSNGGYGSAYVGGVGTTAHRHMWQITHETTIPDGLVVDHLCSNRSCVNPDHLRVVDQQLNSADKAFFPANTSGFRNVYYDRVRKLWAASFKYRGSDIFVGRFSTAEEAAKSVQQEKLLFYGYKFREALDGTK